MPRLVAEFPEHCQAFRKERPGFLEIPFMLGHAAQVVDQARQVALIAHDFQQRLAFFIVLPGQTVISQNPRHFSQVIQGKRDGPRIAHFLGDRVGLLQPGTRFKRVA